MRAMARVIYTFCLLAIAACGPSTAGKNPGTHSFVDAGPSYGEVVLSAPDGNPVTATEGTVDFGGVRTGTTGERTLTLTNKGPGAVAVTATTSLGFVDAFSYRLSADVLDAGAQASLTIAFRPKSVGDCDETLSLVVENGSPAQFLVHVRGSGFRLDSPAIEIAPEALDFAKVAVGTYQIRSVTIANIGDDVPGTTEDNLLLATRAADGSWVESRPAITGPDAADFAIDWPPQGYSPEGLASGASADLRVKFAPRVTGTKQALLELRSNDPRHPVVLVPVGGIALALPPCDLDVRPPSLNFGSVPSNTYLTLSITISLDDPDPTHSCRIDRVVLSWETQQEGAFELPANVENYDLSGGEVLSVPIRFHPTNEGPVSGEVDVIWGSQSYRVLLAANVAQPNLCLMAYPRQLDFGSVGVNCASRDRLITLFNTCASSVTVTSVAVPSTSSSRFSVGRLPPLPRTISGGGSFDFGLTYRPTVLVEDVGSVEVTQAGNSGKLAISVRGQGAPEPAQTDVFTQPEIPKLDFLFILDDSATMADKQSALTTSLSAFFAYLDWQPIDYHVAITTTDVSSTGAQGRFLPLTGSNPRVITRSTPNRTQAFAQNVAVGTGGSETESLLRPFYLALTRPLINGHNTGFYRDEADLAVIIISDAADQDPLGTAITDYESFLIGLKGVTRRSDVTVSAIVPLAAQSPSGCSYDTPTAGLDVRVQTTVRRMFGVMDEVCSPDWTQTLEHVIPRQSGSVGMLSNVPDMTYRPEPIVLTVDAQPWPRLDASGQVRWTYNAQVNTIEFEVNAVPPPGSTIRVSYHVACQP